jgi:SPP1 gp7 family putative phage head morphogenesis protein
MAARLVDFRRIDNIARQKAIDILEPVLNQQFTGIWRSLKPRLGELKKADDLTNHEFWNDVIDTFSNKLSAALDEAQENTVESHRNWWVDRGMGEGIVYDPGLVTERMMNIIGRQQGKQYKTPKDYFSNMASDTRDDVEREIAEWMNTDAPLDTLIEAIQSHDFNPIRAEMIAVTESTRLSSATMMENMSQLGYNDWIWYTANDEIVCEICQDNHGQKFTLDDDPPPAHPRCRCSVGVSLGEDFDNQYKQPVYWENVPEADVDPKDSIDNRFVTVQEGNQRSVAEIGHLILDKPPRRGRE